MSNKAIMTGKYDMKMLSRLGKVPNRALETFKEKKTKTSVIENVVSTSRHSKWLEVGL
jgi:hypothetical protein